MEAGEQSSATFQVPRKGTHIMGFHILPNYSLQVKEMKDFLRQTQIEVFFVLVSDCLEGQNLDYQNEEHQRMSK